MKIFSISVLFCIACTAIQAGAGSGAVFEQGQAYYEQGRYDLAIATLEAAAGRATGNAAFHHLLAKSYGRAAENANWFRAMGLAKKTLKHLEMAVNLDGDNLQYLDDLKDYYRAAPGFLGGNEKKADAMEALIKKITRKHEQNGDALARIK